MTKMLPIPLPKIKNGLNEKGNLLFVWRARKDSNLRPPGS